MFLKKNKAKNSEQANLKIESILVCTGVYNPLNKQANNVIDALEIDLVNIADITNKQKFLQKTLDASELLKADTIVHDILDAVTHIVKSY